MKKLIALLCVSVLLMATVPASADGLGDLFGGFFGGSTTEETETDTNYFEGETETVEVNGVKLTVHSKFKKAMDEYDEFIDEYVALMKNPNDMAKYMTFLTQYAETMETLSAFENDEDLVDDDLAYYTYIMSNISIKLLAVE